MKLNFAIGLVHCEAHGGSNPYEKPAASRDKME